MKSPFSVVTDAHTPSTLNPKNNTKWGFLKIRGTYLLGVPIIRTIVCWGLCWVTLILGNYQIAEASPKYFQLHISRLRVRDLRSPRTGKNNASEIWSTWTLQAVITQHVVSIILTVLTGG